MCTTAPAGKCVLKCEAKSASGSTLQDAVFVAVPTSHCSPYFSEDVGAQLTRNHAPG